MNQTESESSFPRRDFIKAGSFAAVAAMMGGVELIAQPEAGTQPTATVEKPKVKCAVIGLGAWGREILDQLGRLSQADVAAVCDQYPAFLRRGGAKIPTAAQVADYNEILVNKEIKAVIVATPTHEHRAIASAALAAGKHVYCEAPLAHTIEDARSIALAAKEAAGQVFQPGLQMRSDPQRRFLFPFIRSGALGKPVLARAQWHKKQSWRVASPNPEREKYANWRLDPALSLGLVGEIGIHQLDQTGWFLNLNPMAITGHGSTTLWNDGRQVPDTVQLAVDYPGGVRLMYDATLANSFDADYEILHGSDAAVMMRENKAWMFKEVDSPLLGWEVYARKDNFYKETGIALIAGGSKQSALGDKATDVSPFPFPTLYYALEAFLANCHQVGSAAEDFRASYETADKQALREYLATLKLAPAADYAEGYTATVVAIKAAEAVAKSTRIEIARTQLELT